MEIQDFNKRRQGDLVSSHSPRKKRRIVVKGGFFYLKSIDVPLVSSTTGSSCKLICLRSDRIYTIGRKNRCCELVFKDRRISKRHCQIFFDGFARKIFILDGFFLYSSRDLDEIRRRFRFGLEGAETQDCFGVRTSSNGVFVNGYRLGKGAVMELSAGDEVSFACGKEFDCSFGIKIGFIVEKVVFTEEVMGWNCIAFERQLFGEPKTIVGSTDGQEAGGKGNENILISRANSLWEDFDPFRTGNEGVIGRAVLLLDQCKQILQSVDPIGYIRGCMYLNKENGHQFITSKNEFQGLVLNNILEIPLHINKSVVKNGTTVCGQESLPHYVLDAEHDLVNRTGLINVGSAIPHREKVLASEVKLNCPSICVRSDLFLEKDDAGVSARKAGSSCEPNNLSLNSMGEAHPADSAFHLKKGGGTVCSSAGETFYLNRLQFMDQSLLDQHAVVSLPELLYPVESLSRIFIATFTSDVSWFLSYCEVPSHLPVTIACHNTERCWNSSPDKRTSIPFSDFPNLVLVYPPFPEVIAFGKNRKRQGVACHHPKLFVLQRDESIRVIVTSANLVSKQWNNVTNTVWWQDFPRRSEPDYLSLFTRLSDGEVVQDLKSDFTSQLAGFIACLIVDVPSQAHWIVELTKYDFGGAAGHLVASIPGLHIQKFHYPLESMHFLSAHHHATRSLGVTFLGSFESSVVGLSHRFHTTADSNGVQLKTLAAFLGKCCENAYGMSEVVLRRNTNIPADANAVSILICNLDEFSEGDYIQLGFLPRDVAKWVASLCDNGFFRFSACICPKEVLAAALEGNNTKVRLIVYVSQGPRFSEISSMLKPEHVPAICSLVASMQRCVGLWRLQEVLGRYKWPELLETDFIYGSSSIGTSVNAHFLAAFSAAAGKRSFQFSESEESDPEWGRWNASQELKSPSMTIIFPTIERVKDASCEIWPSRRVLCLSEKTWQRLKTVDIFHDSIPHPNDRVGYPMHVKVARRRFQSQTDPSSFGWVYCGSHNFSPAAWGRPVSNSSGVKADGAVGTISGLGCKIHICNYELGIIFIVPPLDKSLNLDNIVLPFVMPAPKYRPTDRPATAQAMKEAIVELAELEKEKLVEIATMEEIMDEEFSEEEEMVEATDYVAEEKEEEKIYAETLWSQVDSFES